MVLTTQKPELRGDTETPPQTTETTETPTQTETEDVAPPPSSLVEVSGTEFTIDGDPLYYGGTHGGGMMGISEASDPDFDWPGSLEYVDDFDGEHYIEDFMRFANEYGMNVMRIASGPSTGGEGNVYHQGPGEYSEKWFRHFDKTIASARRNNIRLICSFLSNNPADEAPNPYAYAQWSDAIDSESDTREAMAKQWNAFFHDDEAIAYYKQLLEYILTRENTITGVEYRNDPTILMWECGNETQYIPPREGESIAHWYREIADHIKSIDGNHLVGTGMYGSEERNDFVADHSVDAIDACTFHLYGHFRGDDLANDPPSREWSPEKVKQYIMEKTRLAREEIGKPVYLGEFGVPQYHQYGWDLEYRNEYFRAMAEAAVKSNLNGTHSYALELHKKYTGEPKITDGRLVHGIYPGDTETLSVLRDYSETATEKSTASPY